METQLSFAGVPHPKTKTPRRRRERIDWQVRAAAFHREHPEVYQRLVVLAREIRARWPGRQVGMSLLFGQVRWFYSFEIVASEEEFRLNENFAAFYAREIMRRERDLTGMFELRTLRLSRKLLM
jgi:hypothetical protein